MEPQRRIVLITGCSSGIGLSTATAFARAGNVVYATVRDAGGERRLRASVGAAGAAVSIVRMDVTDAAARERTLGAIIARHGAVDVLVNNAGRACSGAVEMLPRDLVHDVWATNFFAPTELIKLVLPGMREKRSGHIINISSIVARTPAEPISWCYSTSKVALSVMSEALAHEVADFGIIVRAIEPGFHRSQLAQNKIRQVESTGAVTSSPYRRLEEAVDAHIAAHAAASADPSAVVDEILAASSHSLPWPVRIRVDGGINPDDERHAQQRAVAAARTLRAELGLDPL